MTVEWSSSPPELLLRLDRDAPGRCATSSRARCATRSGTGRLAAGERLPSSRALAARARRLPRPGARLLRAAAGRGLPASRAARPRGWRDAGLRDRPTPPLPSRRRRRRARRLPSGVPDLASSRATTGRGPCGEAAATPRTRRSATATPAGVPELRDGARRLPAPGARRRAPTPGRSSSARASRRASASCSRRWPRRASTTSPSRTRATATSHAVAAGRGSGRARAGRRRRHRRRGAGRGRTRRRLVTPAHQSPTGVVLAPGGGRQLVAWARGARRHRHRGRLRRRVPLRPRAGRRAAGPRARPRRRCSARSASRWRPALRLGWIVVPAGCVRSVADEKSLADRGSPALDQLALARLIESGRYDRHLRRMRASYARRRAVLVGALRAHAPGVRVGGLAAGFHAVATLPPGCPTRRSSRQRGSDRSGCTR